MRHSLQEIGAKNQESVSDGKRFPKSAMHSLSNISQSHLDTMICDSYLLGFIMDPYSYKYVSWNMLGILFLLFDFIYLPIDICFTIAEDIGLHAVMLAGVIYWTLDIGISFLTGFIDSSHKVERRASYIAHHYTRTWFPFDLTIVLLEWILEGVSYVISEA